MGIRTALVNGRISVRSIGSYLKIRSLMEAILRRVASNIGAVREALGFPFYTRDWKEFFPAFFQALKSERVMMFVLLTMIMVVAAFSIVSTLVSILSEMKSIRQQAFDLVQVYRVSTNDTGVNRGCHAGGDINAEFFNDPVKDFGGRTGPCIDQHQITETVGIEIAGVRSPIPQEIATEEPVDDHAVAAAARAVPPRPVAGPLGAAGG